MVELSLNSALLVSSRSVTPVPPCPTLSPLASRSLPAESPYPSLLSRFSTVVVFNRMNLSKVSLSSNVVTTSVRAVLRAILGLLSAQSPACALRQTGIIFSSLGGGLRRRFSCRNAVLAETKI